MHTRQITCVVASSTELVSGNTPWHNALYPLSQLFTKPPDKEKKRFKMNWPDWRGFLIQSKRHNGSTSPLQVFPPNTLIKPLFFHSLSLVPLFHLLFDPGPPGNTWAFVHWIGFLMFLFLASLSSRLVFSLGRAWLISSVTRRPLSAITAQSHWA